MAILIQCSGGARGVRCANFGQSNARGHRADKKPSPAYLCPWCKGEAGTWEHRRLKAGLTIAQAAQLAGCTPMCIAVIEATKAEPEPVLREMLNRIYRGEQP